MTLAKIASVFAATLISTSALAANLNVNCYKGLAVNANSQALMSFEVADNKSNRLVSDINETRSANDSESLPSFLVSQYKFQPLELLVELDDASPEGNLIATLQAIYAGKKSGEKARYLGAYKRYDAGRQINTIVTCVVK